MTRRVILYQDSEDGIPVTFTPAQCIEFFEKLGARYSGGRNLKKVNPETQTTARYQANGVLYEYELRISKSGTIAKLTASGTFEKIKQLENLVVI